MKLETDLLDLTEDALIVRDFDDCVRLWNKGAERLYGWRAAEAIGRNINDLLHEKLAPGFDGGLRENGEWTGELHQVAKDGRIVFVRSRVMIQRDQTGSPRSILICNTDITHLKAVERELLRAQRLATLGRMAGSVAHDLNNELGLMLFSSRILEQKEQDPEVRRSLELFRKGAQQSAGLIVQLLSLAKEDDTGYGWFRPENVIRETTEILRGLFPKSTEMKVIISEGLWPIMGNATDLRQVILNLALNAHDAMPRGGVLIIAVENECMDSSEKRVVIRLAHSGIVMPREIRSQIFEPLFTTSGDDSGPGLGLFAVQKIVTKHRGSIEVSTEPGQGTQVKICLPAGNSDQQLPTAGASHAEHVV